MDFSCLEGTGSVKKKMWESSVLMSEGSMHKYIMYMDVRNLPNNTAVNIGARDQT